MDQKTSWNERYASPGFLFGEEPNEFLKSCSELLEPGKRCLTLADGEGRNGVWLAEQGLKVLATDISEVAQEKAREFARSRGVELDLRLVDLETWEWPKEEFDIVVGIFIQFAGPELRSRIFQRIKDALRPGGLLLLEGYRPEQLEYRTGGPPTAENMYTAPLLEEAFSDFDIISLVAHDPVIREGSGHQGRSAVVDLIARKPL